MTTLPQRKFPGMTPCEAMTDEQKAALVAFAAAHQKFAAQMQKADAAWTRWFTKRQRGDRTSGAGASRLLNTANALSADLDSAAGRCFAVGLNDSDIRSIDPDFTF